MPFEVNTMKRKVATHALSASLVLVTCALLNSFGLADQFISIYMPLAFFAVAGMDFFRTQVLEDGASETVVSNYSFADRFIAYLFVAPFIMPVRVYEQVKRSR